MNVGQPAVSKSVAQLRARLGVPLSVSLDSWPASHRGRAAGSTERAEAATAEDAEVQAQVAVATFVGHVARLCSRDLNQTSHRARNSHVPRRTPGTAGWDHGDRGSARSGASVEPGERWLY